MINRGRTAYDPNTLGGGDPRQAKVVEGGFASFEERIDATKVRARSLSFTDHFSQAAMFFHSQSPIEQRHIVNALRFELGKCETRSVRERVLFLLSHIDDGLAADVAKGLGVKVPKKIDGYLNSNVGADADPKPLQPKKFTGKPIDSAALSIIRTAKPGMQTAKIAMLAADGFDGPALSAVKQLLVAAGGMPKIIAPHGGTVADADGNDVPVDFSLPTVASVLFDAVYVAGGKGSAEILAGETRAVEFVEEAFKHCKAIAATAEGAEVLKATRVGSAIESDPAVIVGEKTAAKKVGTAFVRAISQHRNWEREGEVLKIG
jgi:catalase